MALIFIWFSLIMCHLYDSPQWYNRFNISILCICVSSLMGYVRTVVPSTCYRFTIINEFSINGYTFLKGIWWICKLNHIISMWVPIICINGTNLSNFYIYLFVFIKPPSTILCTGLYYSSYVPLPIKFIINL